MFANRVRKNLDRLEPWAAKERIECFRLYDADMPEYAFAIDIYGRDPRHVYVQEYAPPKTVDQESARERRREVLDRAARGPRRAARAAFTHESASRRREPSNTSGAPAGAEAARSSRKEAWSSG